MWTKSNDNKCSIIVQARGFKLDNTYLSILFCGSICITVWIWIVQMYMLEQLISYQFDLDDING